MGIYLDPPGLEFSNNDELKQAKIDYITKHAVSVTREEFLAWEPGSKASFGVCIVENPGFNAAGVAYDKGEARVFAENTRDGRIKLYFIMPLEEMKVSLRERHLKELEKLIKS